MTYSLKNSTGRPRVLSSVVWAGLFLGWLTPMTANAQGLPVDNGSHIPVALWAIGTAVLGLVLAYGIVKNRQRTKSEKQLTDRATKDLYRIEDQAENPNSTSLTK